VKAEGIEIQYLARNNVYAIDLDKDYPGQKIVIKTFKEFVGVKIVGATTESFGNTVGILCMPSRLETHVPAMAARS